TEAKHWAPPFSHRITGLAGSSGFFSSPNTWTGSGLSPARTFYARRLPRLPLRFLPRFATTELAARTARPSSPVLSKTEFATRFAWRFAFAPFAFFECRHFAPTGHGIHFLQK